MRHVDETWRQVIRVLRKLEQFGVAKLKTEALIKKRAAEKRNKRNKQIVKPELVLRVPPHEREEEQEALTLVI
jgi:hypothetical protein